MSLRQAARAGRLERKGAIRKVIWEHVVSPAHGPLNESRRGKEEGERRELGMERGLDEAVLELHEPWT